MRLSVVRARRGRPFARNGDEKGMHERVASTSAVAAVVVAGVVGICVAAYAVRVAKGEGAAGVGAGADVVVVGVAAEDVVAGAEGDAAYVVAVDVVVAYIDHATSAASGGECDCCD